MINNNLASYQIPTAKRFNDAFLSGWAYFMDMIIALMHLWMFIVAAVASWLAYRLYKRKKAESLQSKLG